MDRCVWIVDDKEGWVPGILLDQTEDTFTVRLDSGEVVDTSGEWIAARNQDGHEEIGDLINLPHLHEPAILHSLHRRYDLDTIYTYNGPILIAINPFKNIPIYGHQLITDYHDKYGKEPLEPHLYGVAAKAYQQMLDKRTPQTILASGESGSGKTVSTKHLMHYLSVISSSQSADSHNRIEDKILLANPLLEAFGNARTVMNDNSSRFGKFIRLDFDLSGKLLGGGIQTYLLERIRTVKQNQGERNFHIFYQMMAGATGGERERWRLLPNLSDYRIISHPEVNDRRDGISDADEWKITLDCFIKLGFTCEEVENVLSIIAGLMRLGNISIEFDADNDIVTVTKDDNLASAAELLRLDRKQLISWLTYRVIETHNETFHKPMELEEAIALRKTMIQTVYERMFNWLVGKINESIIGSTGQLFIGILDIFGFEIFQKNSLEQLHINYTNEYLQQIFNRFVFKLEQEEYASEGIEWDPIDFPDNVDRLHALEKAFKLLNDQSLGPQGSDKKWFGGLFREMEENRNFEFDRRRMVDMRFDFDHYAGKVEYDADGFCRKNTLKVNHEIESLIEGITLPLQRGLDGSRMKCTATTLFLQQLDSLLETIESTTPHYVRCLKPNDGNLPNTFHRIRLVEQLRYGGVLEAVKVARAGFPVRFTHTDFRWRYLCLTNMGHDVGNLAKLHSGKTKVFLKQPDYDVLEDRRISRLNDLVTAVIADWRRYRWRKIFLSTRSKVIQIQSWIRMLRARWELKRLREERASIRIQRIARGYLSKRWYRLVRMAVLVGQLRWRMLRNKRKRMTKAALILQSIWRGWVARMDYLRVRNLVISLQRNVRDKKRRREFSNVVALNQRLAEMEERLRMAEVAKAELAKKENAASMESAAKIEKERKKKEAEEREMTRMMEIERKRVKELALLREREMRERIELEERRMREDNERVRREMEEMRDRMKAELNRSTDELVSKKHEAETNKKVSHELCVKMSDLMVDNSKLRERIEELERSKQKKEGKSWWQILF